MGLFTHRPSLHTRMREQSQVTLAGGNTSYQSKMREGGGGGGHPAQWTDGGEEEEGKTICPVIPSTLPGLILLTICLHSHQFNPNEGDLRAALPRLQGV